jgi:hypothetical protein
VLVVSNAISVTNLKKSMGRRESEFTEFPLEIHFTENIAVLPSEARTEIFFSCVSHQPRVIFLIEHDSSPTQKLEPNLRRAEDNATENW